MESPGILGLRILFNLLQARPIEPTYREEHASLLPESHCEASISGRHPLKLCCFSIRQYLTKDGGVVHEIKHPSSEVETVLHMVEAHSL